MARTSLRDSDPRRIGRYRLTARVGAGGMGVVYLGVAEDGSLVAVKLLRPELADDPDFRRRFGREVSVLTRVRGVCTVRVIEADTESAQPFMVTEYAEGPSLAEYIDQQGTLGPDMLYGLATGLAEALTAIHAAGIVHRDLKPSNVILTDSGPKVIDFGIAQTLDATSVTKTGMMVGSPGFMAPEQYTGRPGPAADVFVWGVTVGYAASGESPFGAGPTEAVMYRVLHAEPDISAVPDSLRPLVEAALVKDPQERPAAHELLDRLTSASVPSTNVQPDRVYDSLTQTVLSLTWGQTGFRPGEPRPAPASWPPSAPLSRPTSEGSLLLESASPGSAPPGRPRRGRVSRRTATIGTLTALALAAAAVVGVVVTNGHNAKPGPLAANEGGQGSLPATNSLPTYGQPQRGVFQTIQRIADSGDTMVTTGSQTSDGVTRQQFFVSSDGGATWRLAPVQLPGGGQPPLGEAAIRIAGGPAGWMAAGPQAIWTSQTGQSWTLAATHGISPQDPGDSIEVVANTPDGFLAAGNGTASGGGNQAVIWVSRDGVNWQRMTASQLGLTAAGATAQNISYATTHGNDTVISDGGSGVWLSTDGGTSWTPVTVPVDHGAQSQISGVSFDGSGLIAIRPGTTASGAPDAVAYFSPNGQTWTYAGTIDPSGGFKPIAVKGGDDGFVVTGKVVSQNIYVAYTSTGTGATWQPTGLLGDTSGESAPIAAVGPGDTIVAVGSENGSNVSQQPVFLKASTAGSVTPVSLTSISGGLIPEVQVNSTAVSDDGVQVAVGSANGYPAVWRKASDGAWGLVTSLSLVSGLPGLAALSSVTYGAHGFLAAWHAGSCHLHLGRGHQLAAGGRKHPAGPGRGGRGRHGLGSGRVPDRRQAGRGGRRVRGRRLVVQGPDQLDPLAHGETSDRLQPGTRGRRQSARLRHGRLAQRRARGVDHDQRHALDHRRPVVAHRRLQRRASAGGDPREPCRGPRPADHGVRYRAPGRAVHRRRNDLAADSVHLGGPEHHRDRADRQLPRLHRRGPVRNGGTARCRAMDLGRRPDLDAIIGRRPDRQREPRDNHAGPVRFAVTGIDSLLTEEPAVPCRCPPVKSGPGTAERSRLREWSGTGVRVRR